MSDQTDVKHEVGWVIERYDNSQLMYWAGRPRDGAWSHKHEDAVRFAREVDASRVLGWMLDGTGRVAEHMWLKVVGDDHQRHVAVFDRDDKLAISVERRKANR
jgi:hypothetical protein